MAETGNLATGALSAGGTYIIKSIKGHEETIPDLDITVLGSSVYMKYQAGDLIEPGEVEIVVQVVTTTGTTSYGLPAPGTSATLTVTFAPPTTDYTGATIAGTGYVKSRKWPDHENNKVYEGSFKFKFDGATGPTFTPAST